MVTGWTLELGEVTTILRYPFNSPISSVETLKDKQLSWQIKFSNQSIFHWAPAVFQRVRHTGSSTIFRFHTVQREIFFIKLSAVLSPSGIPVSFCVTFDLGSFAVRLGERLLESGGQGVDRHNGGAESLQPGSSITLNQCASQGRGLHTTIKPVSQCVISVVWGRSIDLWCLGYSEFFCSCDTGTTGISACCWIHQWILRRGLILMWRDTSSSSLFMWHILSYQLLYHIQKELSKHNSAQLNNHNDLMALKSSE